MTPHGVEVLVVERGQGNQHWIGQPSDSQQTPFGNLAAKVTRVFQDHYSLIGSLESTCQIPGLSDSQIAFLKKKRTGGMLVDETELVTKMPGTTWPSNVPLAVMHGALQGIGFRTEIEEEICFPLPFVDELLGPAGVLEGRIGKNPKAKVDAIHDELGLILQVEAGQGWANKNYLRNLFEGIVLDHFAQYIGIAIFAPSAPRPRTTSGMSHRAYIRFIARLIRRS